ncbi:hypothetical protein, variant [Exophiala oligosperma]|uniref:Major facilitator superfamily (MFS) profile domain-containing protein n=1 Tax=Exophiala oligosperma TaxID=215243 RepID=A0A0D2E9E8_9EURO|nr:hypothetical protein, variant [Exophiala oligosperma]KIW44524.1 hypothetical protein, variant [Exophiala oligosperma]
MTGDTKLPVVDDDGLLVTAAAAATVETGSGHGERRDVCSASQAIDPEAEKRLVWKFDLRILPVLAIMYLFNALDKGNIGNAKTAGLEDSLDLKGDQYNLILSIFFIPYVLTAPFLGIAGKKYVFYRRGELARRLALFYAASSIANAFSGLLAFGVFHIHSGSIANWRYLFVIEGACSMLFAVFAFWVLPYNAASATFLSPEEKELAFYRIQVDSSAVVDEKFDLRTALSIFRHPTTWVILAIEMCLGVPLQSVSLFLPVIVKRLGYSTVKTNLYTVAPNITGAVMLLVLGFASDFTRWRFPFVALGFAFTCIGFIIYACVVSFPPQNSFFDTRRFLPSTLKQKLTLPLMRETERSHTNPRRIFRLFHDDVGNFGAQCDSRRLVQQ